MRQLTAHGDRGLAVQALDGGEHYYLTGAEDSLLLDFAGGGVTEAALLAVVCDRLRQAEASPANVAARLNAEAALAHLKTREGRRP